MTTVQDTCTECGRDVGDAEDFRDADRAYCTECDRYIAPAPGSPLRAEYDDLPRIGTEMQADWQRSKFRLIVTAEGGQP